MKSKFMGLAALALLLASCTQNEVFEDGVSSKVIKFSNLNDRVSSRAANDGDNNYGIYAVLSGGSPTASDWFMTNQEVSAADDSYSPLKYWPTTGTIDFYAYAPYSSVNIDRAGVVWDATTPTFNITYTVPSAANEDFTVASPIKNSTIAGGAVNLVFSHMLSKVQFEAILTDDLTNDGFVITLNSVKLKVAYNQGKNTLENTTTNWSDLAGTDITYDNSTSYMIMPQPADGTEITLNVSITHNGADYAINKTLSTYTLKTADLVSFDKSKHYLFNITIGDTTTDDGDDPVFNVISFKSEIDPWAPSNDIELTNP